MTPGTAVDQTIPPAVDVAALSKSYGRTRALDAVSFVVRPGGVTALLGLNGAGKTTLFQILTGLFVADAGQVRVFGRNMAEAPTAALARIGVVFQQPVLDLDLTVLQNLRFYAGLHGLRGDARSAAIGAALARFGLADLGGKKVRELSGGTRRKLEIARALVAGPDLLLLDEPSTGLDTRSRADLNRDIFALAAERNLAVLWATHLVQEVEAARDVVVLHRGQVVFAGAPAELVARGQAETLEAAFLSLVRHPASPDAAAA